VFVLACYFLLGIEMVAADIEDPFQTGGENLPLERYAATIESSAREILEASAVAPRSDEPLR
jgi:predicted membrane chloride channel (bestrophin family)